MPKRRKEPYQQYFHFYKELKRIELELSNIQEECHKKTGCYLRYGWMFQEPYGHGFPITRDVKDWEHALADFYTEQANKLLQQRDDILKKMYRLASKHYLTGEIDSLNCRYPHLRKPWFKMVKG
jgi:hypothetical protein